MVNPDGASAGPAVTAALDVSLVPQVAAGVLPGRIPVARTPEPPVSVLPKVMVPLQSGAAGVTGTSQYGLLAAVSLAQVVPVPAEMVRAAFLQRVPVQVPLILAVGPYADMSQL